MRASRFGISLVEVLVVTIIIGIMASLILVTVQSARESARRVGCQNNLHQIGIAVTNFSQSTKTFPSLLANRGSKGNAAFDQGAFVTILPELEIAFAKNSPSLPREDSKNLPPPILRCPSGNEFLGYRYSYGSGVRNLNKLDGITRLYKGLSPGEVTDGLSNTSLMSERMSGSQHSKPIGIAFLPSYLSDQAFANDCLEFVAPRNFITDIGITWQEFNPKDLVYSHFSTPNKSHWDCQSGFYHLLITARSYHSGGVMVLYADGHVQWNSSSIDLAVWKAMGTVAGQETKSGPE